MSHVDEGTLHALVDNELDDGERAAVEAHLAGCGDCARRFADATAMARQVVSLLGALDAPAAPVRVVPSPPVAATTHTVKPAVVAARARMFTLRRVALAASLLVVAGVSYRVGRREAAPAAMVLETPGAQPRPSAALRAVPSVVEPAADSYVAAPTPSARTAPRGGPREGDAELARDAAQGVRRAAAPVAAAERPAQQAIVVPVSPPPAPATTDVAKHMQSTQPLSQVVVTGAVQAAQNAAPAAVQSGQVASQAPADASARGASADRAEQVEQRRVAGFSEQASRERSAPVASGAAPASPSAAPKLAPLAGYRAIDEESVPAMTRRRYVSPSGVVVELLILNTLAPPKDTLRAGSPDEFVVSTADGRSTVRWHVRGMQYVLQGPLAPDSLVKLATKLR